MLLAVLLVVAAIGAALAIGSGRIKLPFVLVDASPSAELSPAEASPAAPSPAPSTSPLAVQLAYLQDGDVYLAEWDGANPIRIADGPPGDCCDGYSSEGPMWSPDGRYLAYRGGDWDETRTGTVYINDARGHAVASFPGAGWRVAWSPDSSRVATWDTFEATIAIYGLDGQRQAFLTLPDGLMRNAMLGDFDPFWLPDGTSLLLPPSVVPIDGSGTFRLPENDPLAHRDVTASPNGALLAFSLSDNNLFPDSKDWISVAAADGSGVRRVASVSWPQRVAELFWSPSAEQIAFIAYDVETGSSEIGVVEVASGTITSLVSADAERDEFVAYVSWAPDGDRILFIKRSGNGVRSLWTIDTDGSDARVLVSGVMNGDWQPVSP